MSDDPRHSRKVRISRRSAVGWFDPRSLFPTAQRAFVSALVGERTGRREILAALNGPLPARSLAGLKRRTRVTMGRCQGFFCYAELSRLTEGHFDCPKTEAAE